MIEISVNGKSMSLKGELEVTRLLDELGMGEKRVAVELNREIVPRSRHAATLVRDGDEVEIVHAIGGG